jgi:hypothetical protein
MEPMMDFLALRSAMMEMMSTAMAATTIASLKTIGRARRTKASCQFALTYTVVMAALTTVKNAMTQTGSILKMDASIAWSHWAGSAREPVLRWPPPTRVNWRVEMEKFYISIGTVNLPMQKPVTLGPPPLDKDVMRAAR